MTIMKCSKTPKSCGNLNVKLNALCLTDTSLPIEDVFRYWDESYDVWLVTPELARQVKELWSVMENEPWPYRRMQPRLIVLSM